MLNKNEKLIPYLYKEGRTGDVMKLRVYMIWEPSAFVIHRLYSLGSLKLYMARHQQEKSSRFSVLFDEYPDLSRHPYESFFFCKDTKKQPKLQENHRSFIFFYE